MIKVEPTQFKLFLSIDFANVIDPEIVISFRLIKKYDDKITFCTRVYDTSM